MDFNNNPFLYPKEDGFNPLKPIVERLSTLESTVKNYEDSFETKQLTVTEDANIKNLTVTEDANIKNLTATEGSVNTLQSVNATISDLTSTDSTIENLTATEGNIATLQSTNLTSTDSTIENLTATEGNIDTLESNNATISDLTTTDSTIENLEVTEDAKINNLATDTPIISNAVVGYDVNGKLIPITVPQGTESALYFDYTVDSQEKFDDLLEILKLETLNTYRSIAILGGFGAGEHGEYLYTIDSDSGEANLNNASVVGFNNPKIVITADDADTLKVFKNGSFKDVIFDVGGTVLTDDNITLLYNCKVDDCEILHNTTPINFIIESCTVNKTINNEYITFTKCTLNECETIQSVFNDCSSEILYVSTDSNITSKYSFDGCGIHLDMKKADMTQLETVTLNISSLTNTTLTVLDESSKLKKIILNVDNSDVLSSIIGNNDKKYTKYKTYFEKILKSISPSMRDKVYICNTDQSFTPIFSNNGTDFYLDENMTIPVYMWVLTYDGEPLLGYSTTANNPYTDNLFYTDLTFSQQLITDAISDVRRSYKPTYKLPNYADEYIINGTPIKEYVIKGESSTTIIYSNNNGETLYLHPEIPNEDGNIIEKRTVSLYQEPFTAYGLIKNTSDLLDNNYYLNLNNEKIVHLDSVGNKLSTDLLEISLPKDNYNVQVVSDYNAKVKVENAFFTKFKNN